MADNSWIQDDGWLSDAELKRKPDPRRASILPLYKGEDGVELAWPQFMVDAFNAVTLPKDTLQGYQPTTEDALNFGLTAGVGGGVTSAIAKPKADLGVFLGAKAKGADLKKLAEANRMQESGAPREDIWKQTGWWLKPDGEWSWEMSDDAFQLPTEAVGRLKEEGSDFALIEELAHPAMEQYPTSYNMPSMSNGFQQIPLDGGLNLNSVEMELGDRMGGMFDSKNKRIVARGKSEDQLRNIVLHEMQHAIQDVENWKGRGSNAEWTSYMKDKFLAKAPESWNKYNKLEDDYSSLTAQLSLTQENITNTRIRAQEDPDNQNWKSHLDFYTKKQKKYEEELSSIMEKMHTLWQNNPEVGQYEDKLFEFFDKFGDDSFRSYIRNEGEMISNLTAARSNLTPSERAIIPPWEGFGNKVRYGDYEETIPLEKEAWTDQDYNKFLEEWLKNPKGNLEEFNKDLKEAMNGKRN